MEPATMEPATMVPAKLVPARKEEGDDDYDECDVRGARAVFLFSFSALWELEEVFCQKRKFKIHAKTKRIKRII